MMTRVTSFGGALVLVLGGVAQAAVQVDQHDRFGGLFSGEAVVHISGTEVVIGLDEMGLGTVTRVFFVTLGRAQRESVLRATAARVLYSRDHLAVFLPRERRALVFTIDNPPAIEGERFKASARGIDDLIDSAATQVGRTELAVERLEARKIAEYFDTLRSVVSLDEVERGNVAARIEGPLTKVQIPQPTKCPSSCSTECKDPNGKSTGSCTVSCPAGQCGSCGCEPNTSCSCS